MTSLAKFLLRFQSFQSALKSLGWNQKVGPKGGGGPPAPPPAPAPVPHK